MKLHGLHAMTPWARRFFWASVILLIVGVAMWAGGALYLGGWDNRDGVLVASTFWLTYARAMDATINLAILAAVASMVAQVVSRPRR